MVTIDQLRNDKRFYIDEFNLNRIYKPNIIKYRIIQIKLGEIVRIYRGRVMDLYQTDVYKYLSGRNEDKKTYDIYCDRINMSRRNSKEFDKLIFEMSRSPYDIKKGAIFV